MSAPQHRERCAAPLVVTPGEPAGIGPDLLLMLASRGFARPVVAIADPELLSRRADQLGLAVTFVPPTDADPAPGVLAVEPLRLARIPEPGKPDPGNAAALLASLDRAVDGCLAGRYAALVTGPLSKAVINDGGVPFTGHTEYLAERCGGVHPVMLLAGGGMRVALATTHLPLHRVSAAIDAPLLERVLRILVSDLESRFGVAGARIAVLGLNPHAGEEGHLGDEEVRIISPLLERLRGDGMRLAGPLPADTAFTPERLSRCDAVLAMYHDQGLPVLKHASFGIAVNVTLGLPIIRTSVDHGTAYDLAATGRADPGSLHEALECAGAMAGQATA